MLLAKSGSAIHPGAAMITFASSYDHVQAASVAEDDYNDDLLMANWNPALEVLATFRGAERAEPESSATRDAIEADLDGFLDRVYALATHI